MKVVDLSLEAYHKAAFEKLGPTQSLCWFCADVSTFWGQNWKMTSCDVTWRHHVGFWPKLQKMFLSFMLSFGPNMKPFALFKRMFWVITYFQFNMEMYRKIPPTLDKNPISPFLGMISIQNFQEMCKNKFHSHF